VTLSASIGVAIHRPDDAQDVEMLLGRADRAMYAAKGRDNQPAPQRQALH
jgi:GGDEF domain-containing protein